MSQALLPLPLHPPCTGTSSKNRHTALGAALRLMGGVIYGDMFVMGP